MTPTYKKTRADNARLRAALSVLVRIAESVEIPSGEELAMAKAALFGEKLAALNKVKSIMNADKQPHAAEKPARPELTEAMELYRQGRKTIEENAALRAEVERLNKLNACYCEEANASYDELTAKVAALQADNDGLRVMVGTAYDEIATHRDEAKRLRAAIERHKAAIQFESNAHDCELWAALSAPDEPTAEKSHKCGSQDRV